MVQAERNEFSRKAYILQSEKKQMNNSTKDFQSFF